MCIYINKYQIYNNNEFYYFFKNVVEADFQHLDEKDKIQEVFGRDPHGQTE